MTLPNFLVIGAGRSGTTSLHRYLSEHPDVYVCARYGFPNDMLVHLNVWSRRVRDYPSRPIYGVGERSGIRLWRVVPAIS